MGCIDDLLSTAKERLAAVHSKLEGKVLLKIDTDGHELPVLRGARNLLRDERLLAAVVEHNQRAPGGTAVLPMLERNGLQVFMDGLGTPWPHGSESANSTHHHHDIVAV